MTRESDTHAKHGDAKQAPSERMGSAVPSGIRPTPVASTDDRQAERVERLLEQLAETQMLAFKWMDAHDKLHAGKPYDFPQPADLPDALSARDSELEALREGLREAVGWFEEYRDQHLDKANEAETTDERLSRLSKATRNGDRAIKLRTLLTNGEADRG